MKIVAFNGSPRGANGNTYIMVESFLAGARASGAETEHVLLAEKKISPCKGCFACWIKTPGKCAIDDDMAELLPKLTSADIIIYATPLYIYTVSGILKNFMDRIIPIADPHFAKDEKTGLCRHSGRKGDRKGDFVVISNCGFPEIEHFKALSFFFKTYAESSDSKLLAEIYRTQGELLRNAPLLLKPIVHGYKKLLEQAGKEIVEDSKLSEDLIAKLAKPLVPVDMYIKEANKAFDKLLSDK